jgi:hypothetical protein
MAKTRDLVVAGADGPLCARLRDVCAALRWALAERSAP